MANILATVGGQPITDDDVRDFLAGMGESGAAYDNPQGHAAVLQELIGQKLLLLDAKRNLLEAEPAFRDRLAKLKDRLLASYAAEKALAGVTVTDAELQSYYDENKDRLGGGETVNASHILVDSEEKAKAIYEEIRSGGISFEDAARKYSSCPSKEEGGSLGEFGRGQMVPEFDQAVFAMEVGQITETPVKTQFGYHLIRLNAKNEGKVPAFSEIRDRLRQALLAEKQRKAYESRINQLKILYPVDMR